MIENNLKNTINSTLSSGNNDEENDNNLFNLLINMIKFALLVIFCIYLGLLGSFGKVEHEDEMSFYSIF